MLHRKNNNEKDTTAIKKKCEDGEKSLPILYYFFLNLRYNRFQIHKSQAMGWAIEDLRLRNQMGPKLENAWHWRCWLLVKNLCSQQSGMKFEVGVFIWFNKAPAYHKLIFFKKAGRSK
jgi:hypothetical protein